MSNSSSSKKKSKNIIIDNKEYRYCKGPCNELIPYKKNHTKCYTCYKGSDADIKNQERLKEINDKDEVLRKKMVEDAKFMLLQDF